jgi:hypothetical protein
LKTRSQIQNMKSEEKRKKRDIKKRGYSTGVTMLTEE